MEGRIEIKSSVILIAFPYGLKIGDRHRQSMFCQDSEMDSPQTIMLECFVVDPKSEGMHQFPRFYWTHEMDNYHHLTGSPFLGVKYIYNSQTSNNRGNSH